MAEPNNTEAILGELGSMRRELRSAAGLARGVERAAWGSWGSWGSWSASSAKLPGSFSVETAIGNPDSREQLEEVIRDASSDKFIEVAGSLVKMMEK